MDNTTKHPLDKLINLEKEARNFGFDWPHKEMIVEQAISECHEILDAIKDNEPSERVQEEIGDLLHTAVSLCLFAGFDVEDTISVVNKKFGKRMQAMYDLTKTKGLDNLQGKSMEFMLELWKEAKTSS